MALDNLIYDRTEGDAERWLYLSRKLDTEGWAELTAAEKREWLTQLKGAYNYTDMNRVGSAVEYLGERFTSLITHLIEYRALYGVADDPLFRVPYTAADVDIDPKTDWSIGDNVWADRAARYLIDLTVVRGLLPLAADAPSVPSDMVDLTIGEANDIERLLVVIDEEITVVTARLEEYIRLTAAAWFFSGDLFSGEV